MEDQIAQIQLVVTAVLTLCAGTVGFFIIIKIVNWIRHGHPDGSFEDRYARGEAVEGVDFD